MPIHCYELSPTITPEEVPFKVFGFALNLEKSFKKAEDGEVKTLYAFNEVSNQYYTIGYEKVKKEIEASP